MSGSVDVFEADQEDAAAIAAVHVASFNAAYGGLPGVAGTEPSLDDRIALWTAMLDGAGSEDSPRQTFVAEVGGETVGVCLISAPARDARPGETVAEIVAFYVHPDHLRAGVGTALIRRGLAELAGAGWAEATLWVLVENEPAQAFYDRFGFVSDGAAGPDERTGRPKMRLRAKLPS